MTFAVTAKIEKIFYALGRCKEIKLEYLFRISECKVKVTMKNS